MTAAAPDTATESSPELKRLSVIEPYATKVRSSPPACCGVQPAAQARQRMHAGLSSARQAHKAAQTPSGDHT